MDRNWARQHATVSSVDLNKMLDAGVAPVDLERLMADVAPNTGRYNEFVRTEAVRWLNAYFPQGFGKNAGFMWQSLLEPLHKRSARETWALIENTMRSNPSWRPSSSG